MGKANDDSASKRILILDDNPSLVNVFAKMLSSQGFLVTTETSLKNGLRKISHNTFDGVFVDIPINNYDENDVLTLFYENRIFTKSNILLLSSVDITKLSKWKEYGLYSYIKKPVKRDMLLHMLEHLPSTPSIPSTVKNNDLSSLASGEIIKSEQLQTQIHELESRPSEPTPSPRGSLPLISKEVPQEIPSEHDEATHEQLARLEQLQTQIHELESRPSEPTPSPRGSLPLISKEVPQEIPSEHDEATHEQLARLEQLQTHLREYKLPPLERTERPTTEHMSEYDEDTPAQFTRLEQLQTHLREYKLPPLERTERPTTEHMSEYDEDTPAQFTRLEQLQTHLREYKLPPLERTKKKVLILQPRDSRLEHVLSGLLSVKSQFRPLTHNVTSLGEESKILVKTEIDQLLSEVSHLKNEVHSLNDISK